MAQIAVAESRAALARSPALETQWVRVPNIGDETGSGTFVGPRSQARVSMRFGIIEALQAGRVVRAVEHACEVERVRFSIEDFVARFARAVEREADRRRGAWLETTNDEVNTIVTHASARLAAREATELEREAILVAVDRLQSLAIEAARNASPAAEDPLPFASLDEVLAALGRYEGLVADAANAASQARRLDGISLDVRGGVIPSQDPDWFATVILSYRLGDVVMRRRESTAVAASVATLSEADGLRAHVERLLALVAAQEVAYARRATLLVARRDALEAMLTRLRNEAPNEATDRIPVFRLEIMAIDSELIWLRAMIEQLRPFHADAAESIAAAGDRGLR